jgi:hypothetical protein
LHRLRSVGSFASQGSATRLVNSTLAQDRETVEKVSSGAWVFGTAKAGFDAPTGYEAFARTQRSEPSIREV